MNENTTYNLNICENNIKEYFCWFCMHNFNEEETFYKCENYVLCPKCHPEKSLQQGD